MPVLLARPLQYKSPMITRLRYQSGVFAPFCVSDQTSGWSAAGGSASVLDIAEEREVSNASASRTSSQPSQSLNPLMRSPASLCTRPDEGDEGDGSTIWLPTITDEGTDRRLYIHLSYDEDREHESYCLMLGTRTRFSFAQAHHLNVFWAALNGEEVGGPQSSFQIWRTHSRYWEGATINTVIHVFPWERRLIIRRIGLGTVSGFVQAVLVPQTGQQAPEVIPLAQPAGLDGPTMPALEPLTDNGAQPTSNTDGEAAEPIWQHTPPLPHILHLLPMLPPPPAAGQPSPAPSAASLTAIEDPLPSVPSADRYRLITPDTLPTSSIFQLVYPPSPQHGLTSSPSSDLDDSEMVGCLPEARPSNEGFALRDSLSATDIPVHPETPVIYRKQHRINRMTHEDRLVYPPPPHEWSSLVYLM